MDTPAPVLKLPAERHCAVFETAVGPFGIAWRGDAVTQVLRPVGDREGTIAELQWQSGSELAPAPWPPFITAAVAAMQALLEGEQGAAASLQHVPLDWAGVGQFEREVYEAARRLAPGRTCTYEELAEMTGHPGEGRAVDVALGRNPWPLIVPDHRVVAVPLHPMRPPDDAERTWPGGRPFHKATRR
jgi:methylated-DNA-[protein]-cysteine S-methyltransferase